MKLDTFSILVAAACALSMPSCSMRENRAAVKAPVVTPKPAPPAPAPVDTASELPVSIPQTQVNLPSPQPIQAEALATILPDTPPPPEPATPATKPARPVGPRPEPRQQATAPPQVAAPETQPPAAPAPSRRLRPVESPAERQRMLTLIGAQQQKVQDVLAKAKNRPLTDAEKSAVERIQAFLEQTVAAMKDQDLQQADALSKRALLLSQELDK